MLCAIYGRKSTDDSDRNDEARSTTRQIERATAYAQAKGWTVDPRYIFVDDAVSGAEWKHRSGFNALLAALEPRPAFGVLVVSELSRIGRDTVRVPYAVQQIEEAGVEIHGYLSGQRISVEDEMGEMQTMLHSLAASYERRRARQRTYDALRRRAEAGAVAGNRVFGYVNHRNGDGYVHRVIHEPEAATVRRIFTMYSEGSGITRITKALNADQVPPPRDRTGSWPPSAIREMLHRTLYAGTLTWNRKQIVMRRGTKTVRDRPKTEWLERAVPDLAIIDRDLWDRVQSRLKATSAKYLRITGGRLLGSPSGHDGESPYLLSGGLATCGLCGANMVAVSRPGKKKRTMYYSCGRYHKRGKHACRNGVQIRLDVLDTAVVDILVKALEPDVIDEAVRSAVKELQADAEALKGHRQAVTAELATIATRERRLLDLLVDGDTDASAGALRGRLREELARRDALTAELARHDATPGPDADAVARDVQERAKDLRGLLTRHVAQARQVVKMLLEGRLVCQPFEENGEIGYSFTATGTYRRLGVPISEALTPFNAGRDAPRSRAEMLLDAPGVPPQRPCKPVVATTGAWLTSARPGRRRCVHPRRAGSSWPTRSPRPCCRTRSDRTRRAPLSSR